jgi:NADPH2:quinone reductase
MKAVVARSFGPPAGMALEDWPSRSPGPGEVRVKLMYAGVSFVDVLVAAGKYQVKPPLPFVPGSEFSGEIVEIGPGVDQLTRGDLVCGGNMGGVMAEETTLPARRVQKLPSHVSMEQAAVLRASSLTAWYSLIHRGNLVAGETVLVLGAAGAVGIAVCQLARHLGAKVIASASSDEKRDFALANGAEYAIDTHATDWRDRVTGLTSGAGVDIVVDPVGGTETERAFRSLAYRGRHLMVGFASGTIPSIPANLPLLKGASLVGVLTSYFSEKENEAEAASRVKILELFAAGVLAPPVGAVYALDEFVAAMEAAKGGKVLGRVLLRMN